MLKLWRLYRGGGMGAGSMPEPGGTLDQSPYMIEAFAVMDAEQNRVDDERRERERTWNS